MIKISLKPQSYQLPKTIKWVPSGTIDIYYNNGLNGEIISATVNGVFLDTKEEADKYFENSCKQFYKVN